jgi:hypothetical protein
MQIEIGQRPAIARFAFPDQRRLVAARSAQVAIEAVDARVDRAADEPLRVWRLPVEHRVPTPGPFQLRGKSRPERFRIAFGFGVQRLVARHGLGAEFRGRRERAVLTEEILELLRRIGLGIGHGWEE